MCTTFNAVKLAVDALTAANQIQYFDFIKVEGNLTDDLAKVNIVSPTSSFQSTFGGGIVWRKGLGTFGNASSHYVNTGFNPNNTGTQKFQKNDCHISIFLRQNKKEDGAQIGVWNGTNDGLWIAARWGTGGSADKTLTRLNAATSASHGIVIPDTRGWIYAERTSSTTEKLYYNGVLKSTITNNNSTNIPNGDLWEHCIHDYVGGTAVYLPSSNNVWLSTAGKSGANTVICNGIFEQLAINLGYAVQTDYYFGDSIIQGYGATAEKDFVSLINAQLRHDKINNGVGGQTITQGTDNYFLKANIPTYNSKYDGYINFGWLANDCWKTHDGGQAATTTRFISDYEANAINEALTKGWPLLKIRIFAGFYCEDNSNFTQTTYLSFRDAAVTMANARGIKVIDSFSWMQNMGGSKTIDATDKVHLTDLGNSNVATNALKCY